MSAAGRVATWIAVGALALNAVLLGVAGLVANRPWLVAGAGLAVAGALAVVLAWRRHQRQLDQLRRDRTAMRDETTALRDLLRRLK